MAKGTTRFSPLVIAPVAVGILAILIGNAQIALGRSAETQSMGHAVRSLGLVVCTLTGIVFLLSRMGARLKSRTRWPKSTPAAAGRITQSGPSPTLLAAISAYCMFLLFLGIFTLVTSLSALFSRTPGFYRFGGMPLGANIVYVLFQPTLMLVSSFLIWFMTDAIRRMAEQLDDVSHEIAKLRQDSKHVPAADATPARDTSHGLDSGP